MHKFRSEGLLVILKHLFPTALVDDHALSDLLSVGKKFMQRDRHRRARQIPIRRLVQTIDQVTGLLKFYGKKVSSANVDSLSLDALRIASARYDLGSPEIEAVCVRLAVKKISIVLPDKELRVVDEIGHCARAWVVKLSRIIVAGEHQNRSVGQQRRWTNEGLFGAGGDAPRPGGRVVQLRNVIPYE